MSSAVKYPPNLQDEKEARWWYGKLCEFSTPSLLKSFEIIEDKIKAGEIVCWPKYSEFVALVRYSPAKEAIVQIRAILAHSSAKASRMLISDFEQTTNNLAFFYIKSFGSFEVFCNNHVTDYQMQSMEKRLEGNHEMYTKNEFYKQQIDNCKKKSPQPVQKIEENLSSFEKNEDRIHDHKNFESFCKDVQKEDNFRLTILAEMIKKLNLSVNKEKDENPKNTWRKAS